MQSLFATGTPPDYHSRLARSADRTFLLLALIMGAASLGIAIWTKVYFPFLALTLPSLVALTVVVRLVPGTLLSRNAVVLVLMALVAVMIQQANGLVEMHFGVFVVLALMLYYRDWRPVITGAVAIAVHHLAFFWMQSQGMPIRAFTGGSGLGIVFLHAVYVVVETVFVCIMAIAMRRQIDVLGADPEQLQNFAHAVAHDLDTSYIASWELPAGTLAASLTEMEQQLHSRRLNEQTLNRANAQIRASLDASRTGMMIADTDHVIRYANHSVIKMLEGQLDELRGTFPDFALDTLVGNSIHRFHKNPERIRGLLNQLDHVHTGQIQIGNAYFSQAITPVFDDNGQRSGFVVEWSDRTEELKLENSISGIIAAAGTGDFSQRLQTTVSSGFIGTLTSGINTLLGTMSGVTGEVRQMLSALSHGDLDYRITGQYSGDLAAMKDDANATAEQLTAMLQRIRTCATGIQAAASEIASGNSDLSIRTEQQAANLEETAASMEELTSTVHQNANTSRQANELAHNATAVAEQGGQVVDLVVQTMQTIEQSSRRIADIISVIDGIAFQTNILALNAAVEAARAGEQGRGFAVVASEVRNLAQRSASAAKEIKELITDSVEKVNHGSGLVNQAGDTMLQVLSAVRSVGQMMAGISAASQEQTAGIDQVRNTVVQMDATTQQNAALVEEANAAARALEEEAGVLMEAVSRFRYHHAD